MNTPTDSNDICDWIERQQAHMLDSTISLANVNSGSTNVDGLHRMADEFLTKFRSIADGVDLTALAPIEQVDDSGNSFQQETGKLLSAHKRPDAPLQILLCGHMDTVFSQASSFQQCSYLDDNTLNGPGVADMKGGLMVLLTALTAFEKSSLRDLLGWRVIINPDEEIGSLASASVLEQAAKQAHVGLVYEPALADGTLAGERKGSGNFSLVVKGKAAHAGREFELGRNAIAALAQAMSQLHELNGQRDGVTINLGRINGGGALNSVADNAVCHFNVRTKIAEDEVWVDEKIQAVITFLQQQDGINATLHGKFSRAPKQLTPANQQLFSWLFESANTLGISVQTRPTGGCCDGNNLAKAGLPNIDTLGVRGANIHTDKEILLIDSLAERAKLSFVLLETLARQHEHVIAMRASN